MPIERKTQTIDGNKCVNWNTVDNFGVRTVLKEDWKNVPKIFIPFYSRSQGHSLGK